MTDQTISIIMLAKKSYKMYPESRSVDRIIHYLSDRNICEKEHFRDFHYELTRYIRNIMYDYIDSCDKPSDFLKSLENIKRLNYGNISELECILQAFRLTEVISNMKYINGFNKEIIEKFTLSVGGEENNV